MQINAPVKASLRQLGLDLLCTNRDLSMAMPMGKRHTDFTIVVNAPMSSIRCIVGSDRASALPRRRRLCMAVHLPSRAELSHARRHRRGSGRRRATRTAAALCASDVRRWPPARSMRCYPSPAPQWCAAFPAAVRFALHGVWRWPSRSTKRRLAEAAPFCLERCSIGFSQSTCPSTALPRRCCGHRSVAK